MSIEAILASLVAAVLFTFFGSVLKHRVVPFFRSTLNPTLDLSGTWYCHFVTPSGNPHDLTLDLRQRWRFLEGNIVVTMHIASTGGTVTVTKIYKLEGEVRERLVRLSAWNADKKALGAVTQLLEVVGDGNTMRGLRLWYSITNKAIQSSEVEWLRTGSGRHGD